MSKLMPPVEFLRGKRVVLRPPERADIPTLLRWINDMEILQYIGAYLPMTETGEIEWFEGLAKRRETNTIFIIVTGDKPIGTIGLHDIHWRDRTATMGFMIGEKDCWGKGYGTEALMLVLHYAFHALNLHKICASVSAFNGRSLRCQEKCGFVREGLLKAHHFKNGAYHDTIVTAVFRDNWEPFWEKFGKENGL
ncbi:MAG: GNAT family N-acetyltransferase [Candidatus Niyogibacteria bacterium]|nr:GNAT family N-acetyltransferase [Candidatus Niyogibacteria bacterium]